MTSQSRQLIFDFENTIENSDEISDLVKQFLKAWIIPLLDGDRKDNNMLVYLVYITERLVLLNKKNSNYVLIDGSPETMNEYNRLNPY